MLANVVDRVSDFLRPTWLRWTLLILFLVTLPWTILIIPIYQGNNFTYTQLNLWLILAVVAIGMNLLTGLTGMISLGHSAIYAVGAFTCGYFMLKQGFPYPLAIIMAMITAALVGFVLGLPALRLSGPYLAVATFSFAIATPQFLSSSKEVSSLFANQNDITAQIGVFRVPRQTFPGFEIANDLGRYYLFLIIFLIMVVLAMGIWRSRTGRALRAIRDSETAAQAMGVNAARYKVTAFVISAIFAGVGGSMYTAQVGQLEANDLQFSAVEAVLFLAAIILGGLGSITGSVIGAALLIMLPNVTNALKQIIRDSTGVTIENFESIFYGLIIILCVFYMPNGVVGMWHKALNKIRAQKKSEAAAPLAVESTAAALDAVGARDKVGGDRVTGNVSDRADQKGGL